MNAKTALTVIGIVALFAIVGCLIRWNLGVPPITGAIIITGITAPGIVLASRYAIRR